MKYTQPALRFETRVEWALLMCKRTHVHEVDKTQYIRGWLDGYAGKEQGQ